VLDLNPYCGEHAIKFVVLLTLFLSLLPSALHAQANFFHGWEDRVRATTANQPAWSAPLVTTFSGVAQRVRFDFVRQYAPNHTVTCNYGNSKGVQLIPFARTEIDLRMPPYIQHHAPNAADGAGDFSVATKYRLFAANEKHGNYSSAAQLIVTFPTASHGNGTSVSTLTPTLVGGKGRGRFDLQSSIGAVLPTSSVSKIGRAIVWNSVAQYNVRWHLCPELEVNSTYYHGGSKDGKNQTFLTPGLVLSRMKLRHDPEDRLGLTFGGGLQIATSRYHAYNHGLILSGRLTF
jgi:hypothetical protein